MEKLVIAGREFTSRLFLGTGKFDSNDLMARSIMASGTEMVTVAMKRIELEDKEDDMLKHIVRPEIQLLPNTSGVRNAEEAVFAAQMAREAFGTNWLKLEIHPDPRYLLPDSTETLKATEQLVKLGFVVLPYCQADPTPVSYTHLIGIYLFFGIRRRTTSWFFLLFMSVMTPLTFYLALADQMCIRDRCRPRRLSGPMC